jgi:predicted nuclease of predicted toxin-antitoxin system
MSQSSDRSILDFARAQGRTVVTLDADFHALLAVANEAGLQ